MSLALPVSSSPLRECFEVADLVRLEADRSALISVRDAIVAGRSAVLKSGGAIRSVNFIALRADGVLVLLEVRKIGHKTLWVFGALAGCSKVAA